MKNSITTHRAHSTITETDGWSTGWRLCRLRLWSHWLTKLSLWCPFFFIEYQHVSWSHYKQKFTFITGINPEAIWLGVDRYDRPLWPGLLPGPPSQTPGGLGQRYWSVSAVTWPPKLELRRCGSSGPSSLMNFVMGQNRLLKTHCIPGWVDLFCQLTRCQDGDMQPCKHKKLYISLSRWCLQFV